MEPDPLGSELSGSDFGIAIFWDPDLDPDHANTSTILVPKTMAG
jgi:hypothetical protein